MSISESELTAQDMLPGVLLDQIPAVFDAKFLAKILDVSVSTAQTVMSDPDFPVWRISPHTHRILKSEFLQYVADQSRKRKG